jgi:hypothetical protein
MDDAAVMTTSLLTVPSILLKNVDALIAFRDLGSDSQTDDAGTYDYNVRRFHGYHQNRFANKPLGTHSVWNASYKR